MASPSNQAPDKPILPASGLAAPKQSAHTSTTDPTRSHGDTMASPPKQTPDKAQKQSAPTSSVSGYSKSYAKEKRWRDSWLKLDTDSPAHSLPSTNPGIEHDSMSTASILPAPVQRLSPVVVGRNPDGSMALREVKQRQGQFDSGFFNANPLISTFAAPAPFQQIDSASVIKNPLMSRFRHPTPVQPAKSIAASLPQAYLYFFAQQSDEKTQSRDTASISVIDKNINRSSDMTNENNGPSRATINRSSTPTLKAEVEWGIEDLLYTATPGQNNVIPRPSTPVLPKLRFTSSLPVFDRKRLSVWSSPHHASDASFSAVASSRDDGSYIPQQLMDEDDRDSISHKRTAPKPSLPQREIIEISDDEESVELSDDEDLVEPEPILHLPSQSQHTLMDNSDDSKYIPSTSTSHTSTSSPRQDTDGDSDEGMEEESSDEEDSISQGSPEPIPQANMFPLHGYTPSDCMKAWYARGQVAIRCKQVIEAKYKEMCLLNYRDVPDRGTPCYFGAAYFGKYRASKFDLIDFLDLWIPLSQPRFNQRSRSGSLSHTTLIQCAGHKSPQCISLYAIAALSRASRSDTLEYGKGTMEASHLCHQRSCVSTDHLVVERQGTNADRQHCQREAHHLRDNGIRIPSTCDRHNPPCLMREAALTREEIVVGGFAMARGFVHLRLGGSGFRLHVALTPCLGTIDDESTPTVHPYSYFHYPGLFPDNFGERDGPNVLPFWRKRDGLYGVLSDDECKEETKDRKSTKGRKSIKDDKRAQDKRARDGRART